MKLVIEGCTVATRKALVEYLQPMAEEVDWTIPDKSKLQRMIEMSTSAADSLCLVARRGKWVVGGLSVTTGELPWGQKRYGRIDMIAGANDEILQALIDETMDWVGKRRGILILTYMFPVRTRAMYLLGKAGFSFEGSVFMWRKYNGISKQNIQTG